VTREQFDALVDDAVRSIPARFRATLRNVVIVVEDEPSQEVLDEMEIDPPDTLFWLYQGTPSPSAGGTRRALLDRSRSSSARSSASRRTTMSWPRDRRDPDPRTGPLLRTQRGGDREIEEMRQGSS
jgi:hypothetical protein